MRNYFHFALFIFSLSANAGEKNKLTKYFVDTSYNFVDTVYFNGNKNDFVIIAYLKAGKNDISGKEGAEESLLIYNHGHILDYYPEALNCFFCVEWGNEKPKLSAIRKGRVITFVQNYMAQWDSVTINFSGNVPFYEQIVYRSISNEIHSLDYSGNYLLLPKRRVYINEYPFYSTSNFVLYNQDKYFVKKIIRWKPYPMPTSNAVR